MIWDILELCRANLDEVFDVDGLRIKDEWIPVGI